MRIVIPGDPIAKMRHRLTTVNGYARQYDPQEKIKKSFSLKLKESIKNLWHPQELAMKVDLIFEMDAIRGSSNAESNFKAWQCSYPLKRDLDNMSKFVLDCGNQILWPDDRYITELNCKKRYSKTPCTIIQVEIIPEIKMIKEHEKIFKTFSPDDISDLRSHVDLIQNALYPSYRALEEPGESQLAAAADLLIKFANDWTDKLKKIKEK